jgi:hypothetical protein
LRWEIVGNVSNIRRSLRRRRLVSDRAWVALN